MAIVCLLRRTVRLLQLPDVALLRHAVRLMHGAMCRLHREAACVGLRMRWSSAAIWLQWLLQQRINDEYARVWSSMMQPAGHMQGKRRRRRGQRRRPPFFDPF